MTLKILMCTNNNQRFSKKKANNLALQKEKFQLKSDTAAIGKVL